MNLQLYPIAPQLQPYIKVICTMESSERDTPSVFRVLPDTCVELFVSYSNEPIATITGKTTFANRQSFVVFRMSNFMDVQMQAKTGCIAVCFYPGASYHFFSQPIHEVADTVTELTHFWKNMATEMEERVSEATNNHERVAIIQHYLIKQLAKKREDDQAIQYCLGQINYLKGQVSVVELSHKVNISQRQLSRRFNHCVGLSPKEFAKINRFIHSLAQLKKYPSVSLTEVAYESGYYDQAHFIHTYKEYTGITPSELLVAQHIIY